MGREASWPGVVCGLEAEAAVARLFLTGVGVSAGRPDRVRAIATDLLARGAGGLVSFGIAGGLDPLLKPGDIVIGSGVTCGETEFVADKDWVQALASAIPGAKCGRVYGADHIVHSTAEKAQIHAQSHALCVDMESRAVAEIAVAAGRPFAVLRAVADPADLSLPQMVANGLDSDGRPAICPIITGLALAPRQLPALVRTGRAANVAMSALLRRCGVGLLGLGAFAGLDLG